MIISKTGQMVFFMEHHLRKVRPLTVEGTGLKDASEQRAASNPTSTAVSWSRPLRRMPLINAEMKQSPAPDTDVTSLTSAPLN